MAQCISTCIKVMMYVYYSWKFLRDFNLQISCFMKIIQRHQIIYYGFCLIFDQFAKFEPLKSGYRVEIFELELKICFLSYIVKHKQFVNLNSQ